MQKVLFHPSGFNSFRKSLKISNEVPYLIIAANVEGNASKDMQELNPSRIHQIKDHGDKVKYLLSVVEYDSEQQELKGLNLSKSYLIEGDFIWSLLQYSDDSIMICGRY